jgi:hypothetical protein
MHAGVIMREVEVGDLKRGWRRGREGRREEGKRLARDAGRGWPRQRTTARDSTTGNALVMACGVFGLRSSRSQISALHPASLLPLRAPCALQCLFAPAARCRHCVLSLTFRPPHVVHHARRSPPAARRPRYIIHDRASHEPALWPPPFASHIQMYAANIVRRIIHTLLCACTVHVALRAVCAVPHAVRIARALSPPPRPPCAVFPLTLHSASHWHAVL